MTLRTDVKNKSHNIITSINEKFFVTIIPIEPYSCGLPDPLAL